MQLPRAVDGEEVSLADRALLEGLDARKCLILQLGLSCPTKFCQEQGRNIASCSNYVQQRVELHLPFCGASISILPLLLAQHRQHPLRVRAVRAPRSLRRTSNRS